MDAPPPDLPTGKDPHAAEAYTALGHVEGKRQLFSRFFKVLVNLAAALGFVALAGWLLADDLNYPGDHLFQISMSLPYLAGYLIALGILSFVFAFIPKRIVFMGNILVILRGAIGFPLNVWIGNSTASIVLSSLILAVAVYYLIGSVCRILYVGARPWMNFKHSMGIVGIGLGLLIIGFFSTILGYTHAGRNLMGDYVRISPTALSLVERAFAKEGQVVYLVGMMHIGSGSYYKTLQERLNAPPTLVGYRRLVLTEGVSDKEGILPEDFASGETYARWARIFGLEVQESFTSPGFGSAKATDHTSPDKRILFRNADIDVSQLEDNHQETLVSLLSLLDETDPMKLLVAQTNDFDGLEIEELFVEGLIKDRNDVLMAEFTETGPDYEEIYIPWGAAHLSDLEERLLGLGYEQVAENVHPIVNFWKK